LGVSLVRGVTCACALTGLNVGLAPLPVNQANVAWPRTGETVQPAVPDARCRPPVPPSKFVLPTAAASDLPSSNPSLLQHWPYLPGERLEATPGLLPHHM